ncbi:MAG: hypothetical protein ACRDRZ_15075 [Pseudonocardiaceae bacterium]
MSTPFDEPAEADARDAAEQRAAVVDDEDGEVTLAGVPLEASEADVMEQFTEVPDDEDDYPG